MCKILSFNQQSSSNQLNSGTFPSDSIVKQVILCIHKIYLHTCIEAHMAKNIIAKQISKHVRHEKDFIFTNLNFPEIKKSTIYVPSINLSSSASTSLSSSSSSSSPSELASSSLELSLFSSSPLNPSESGTLGRTSSSSSKLQYRCWDQVDVHQQ